MISKMTYLGPSFRAVSWGTDVPMDLRRDELKKWCTEFHNQGFAPQYEGGSAGNLSFRLDAGSDKFIVTGAGIVSKERVLDNSLVLVTGCDPEKEIVYYQGTRKPSSESIMHYAIYRQRKDVGAVFHGHSEEILACVDRLTLTQTKTEEKEGTKGLAKAVLEVLGNENFIVLKNHGFVSLGKTLAEAGERAVAMQRDAKAYFSYVKE